MVGNLLAGAGLCVALLTGTALLFIGLSGESGRDGGRAMGTAIACLPFLAGMALALAVACWRGSFDWLGLSRGVTALLVLVLLVCAVLVTGLSAATRLEPASQVPWAMLPLRSWLHLLWPPLLWLGAAWALWPAVFGAWPLPLGRGLLAAPALVSVLACALMAVQLVLAQQQRADDELRQQIADGHTRDGWIREQVIAADPQKDLVSLMNQTSQYETPDIRALALAKVHSHPHLNDALAEMLRNRWCDHAFTFLASNAPPDAAALAPAVRDGLFGMADEIRERMRETHTLRADEFVPEVERLLATAERFAPQGVDLRPALQAVRAALDQPRQQPSGTPNLVARRRLDQWLASHPA